MPGRTEHRGYRNVARSAGVTTGYTLSIARDLDLPGGGEDVEWTEMLGVFWAREFGLDHSM